MAEVVTRDFRVSGMTCMGCVATVKRVVSALPGVENVDVSLDTASARVAFDPAATPTERIVSALTDAGYEAAPAAR